MVLKIGFLKQLLIHLTITVRTTTCAGERAVTVQALVSGAGGMPIACSRCTTGLLGKFPLPVDRLRKSRRAVNRYNRRVSSCRNSGSALRPVGNS
jgi:hypothetical protein